MTGSRTLDITAVPAYWWYTFPFGTVLQSEWENCIEVVQSVRCYVFSGYLVLGIVYGNPVLHYYSVVYT